MSARKEGKRLVSTYVTRRPTGKFEVRVVDARTRAEGRCTKADLKDAIACSKGKSIP